jgi:predicted esterase YcpF (UPF0227 family)
MTSNLAFQKTFPSLMAGKKLLYVHGFGSAGSTHTAQALRTLMPQATVLSPDLPIHPAEALELLHTTVAAERPDLIIGTSMGGMYTEQLNGFDRICVNPALQMGDTMHEHGLTGKQTFQNPRQDGVQEFIVTKAMVKEYKEATELCFQGIDNEERRRVFGLFGDNDQVVHTYDLFLDHYPNAIHFHGEHRLNDKVLLHYIIPVIRWIDDRQEGRERRRVVIDYDVMHDSYMNPVSSMRKAYELLIENYDVYILAAAPTARPDNMKEVQAWAEEHINVPAWNHIVYTNQPGLVNADYLITSPDKVEDIEEQFLGTVLPIGKDELKTFEEVITFFDRLGGQ